MVQLLARVAHKTIRKELVGEQGNLRKVVFVVNRYDDQRAPTRTNSGSATLEERNVLDIAQHVNTERAAPTLFQVSSSYMSSDVNLDQKNKDNVVPGRANAVERVSRAKSCT
jgi:hypothetical protein